MHARPALLHERLDAGLHALSPVSFHAVVGLVAEIEAFKGWWSGRAAAPDPRLSALREHTLAVSAAASVRIEWSGLPSPYAARPPAGGILGGDGRERPRLEAGYALALREVFERHREMALSPECVARLHAGLFDHLPRERGRGGRYRTSSGRGEPPPRTGIEAIALRPPDPERIPGDMDALLRWTEDRLSRGRVHPALVTAAFVLEFIAIRPFEDGNGRLSRILTNLLLLKAGYDHMPYGSLEKAIEERKAEYYIALRKTQASRTLPRQDFAPWARAFLETMRAQTREVRTRLGGVPRDDLLSDNQRGVLMLLDRHGMVTNRLVAGELDIPRETVKQVLNRLVALNALRRLGSGRAVRYVRP